LAGTELTDHERDIESAFSRQAESFNASAIANADELLEAIVESARPQPAERWLEAACGPGIVSRRLGRLVGSVHGIDLTPAMIATARREAQAAGIDNVTFEVADAASIPAPDSSYDGAVTRFSLHHIPVPARVVRELARVVRPGGTIAVLDHLADPEPEARAWAHEIERLRDPSHWACLSRQRLLDLGRESGLALEYERRFSFELDFEDWLQRGTTDAGAHELVEQALAENPTGTGCFNVHGRPGGRVLRLQMWLGVWRVAPVRAELDADPSA
jgi:ubiquinone/menaquinone biosynthesis C-methylase UbiE